MSIDLEKRIEELEKHVIGNININYKLLSETAKDPAKSRIQEDAGWDLFADEDVHLVWGIPTTIKTNVAFEFPHYYHGFVWDRSSMGKKGIKVHGGMIDNGYRGSVDVVLVYGNSEDLSIGVDTDYDGLDRPVSGKPYLHRRFYKINKGDKIAQLVFVKLPVTNLTKVNELKESNRGALGFGSSGK